MWFKMPLFGPNGKTLRSCGHVGTSSGSRPSSDMPKPTGTVAMPRGDAMPTNPPIRFRHVKAFITMVAAGSTVVTAPAPAPAAPPPPPPVVAGSGRAVTASPGDDLNTLMRSLQPGDTLSLHPGTYVVHTLRPVVQRGTASAPITVRAADPARRPLLKGHLKLWGASYWQLDGLRVQTIDARQDALSMFGGTGWTVTRSEFFGAAQTGAYSNVGVHSDGTTGTGSPKQFRFVGNCVHDAGRTNRGRTDHNIYVAFTGDTRSGGLISRNVIYGHPQGSGIKLGNGGVERARGPWGVRVTQNSIGDGAMQVLLHGDIRNNTVSGNLLWRSIYKIGGTKSTSVYLNNVVGSGNVFTHNYANGATMFSYGSRATIGVDNGLRPAPRLNAVGTCGGYRPTTTAGKAYGVDGTGAWPRW